MPPFYSHMVLKPYVFFDVAHGRERRGGTSGGSLRNEVARLFTQYAVVWLSSAKYLSLALARIAIVIVAERTCNTFLKRCTVVGVQHCMRCR